MADITKAQKAEIRRLTRQAQRRMERAYEGQRRVLEHEVLKATGATKWSSAYKGFSYERAEQQIQLLQEFLGNRISKRVEWEGVKRRVTTLSKMGYHITDEELADILIQMKERKWKDIYRAVNLVEAKKGRKLRNALISKAGREAPRDIQIELTAQEITTALNYKITQQQALEQALAAQEKIQAHYEKYKL